MRKIRKVPDVGHMRHQCDILKPVSGTNSTGNRNQEYDTYMIGVWCAVEPWPISEAEMFRSERTESVLYKIFEIIYDVQIQGNYRLSFNGYIYRINKFKNIGENNFFLQLKCTGTKAKPKGNVE